MKKILVIGKGGQVSENLIQLLNNQYEFEYRAIGQDQLDLSQPQFIYERLSFLNFKPDIIINAAAYTAVDKADEEKDICNNINNLSVAEIAKFATKYQALLVHYSTDYVYNGEGDSAFVETNEDHLGPLNYYGETKLAGENAIITSGCKYIIFRTSWVYNHQGSNFVKTILKLLSEKPELRIINDQIGSPTYAYDIAQVTLLVLNSRNIKYGIYHLVAPEQISWHQFAVMIKQQAEKLGFPIITQAITPIATSEYHTKAVRPLNSRLSTEKLRVDYGVKLPSIATSLRECLQRIRLHS